MNSQDLSQKSPHLSCFCTKRTRALCPTQSASQIVGTAGPWVRPRAWPSGKEDWKSLAGTPAPASSLYSHWMNSLGSSHHGPKNCREYSISWRWDNMIMTPLPSWPRVSHLGSHSHWLWMWQDIAFNPSYCTMSCFSGVKGPAALKSQDLGSTQGIAHPRDNFWYLWPELVSSIAMTAQGQRRKIRKLSFIEHLLWLLLSTCDLFNAPI